MGLPKRAEKINIERNAHAPFYVIDDHFLRKNVFRGVKTTKQHSLLEVQESYNSVDHVEGLWYGELLQGVAVRSGHVCTGHTQDGAVQIIKHFACKQQTTTMSTRANNKTRTKNKKTNSTKTNTTKTKKQTQQEQKTNTTRTKNKHNKNKKQTQQATKNKHNKQQKQKKTKTKN